MKTLIISHGDMAEGMHSTLTNFFGASNLYWANVSLETGTTGLIEKIEGYLKEWEGEQVVICSDLKGGSANQTAFRYLSRPETYLISGMNLSLLLQLSMCSEVDPEILKDFISQSKDDMVLVNELINAASDDDE